MREPIALSRSINSSDDKHTRRSRYDRFRALYRWLLQDSSSPATIDLNNLFERSTILIFIIRSIIDTRIIIRVNVHYSAKRMLRPPIDSVLGHTSAIQTFLSATQRADTVQATIMICEPEMTKLALASKDNHPEATRVLAIYWLRNYVLWYLSRTKIITLVITW